MKSTFEKLGGAYKQVGDYLLPEVEAPKNPEVGFWGLLRRKYLLEHHPALYTALFLGGKLAEHLREIVRSATQMFDQLVDQPKTRNGATEQLKATVQMKWVRRMNAVRHEAAEIVTKELRIFNSAFINLEEIHTLCSTTAARKKTQMISLTNTFNLEHTQNKTGVAPLTLRHSA